MPSGMFEPKTPEQKFTEQALVALRNNRSAILSRKFKAVRPIMSDSDKFTVMSECLSLDKSLRVDELREAIAADETSDGLYALAENAWLKKDTKTCLRMLNRAVVLTCSKKSLIKCLKLRSSVLRTVDPVAASVDEIICERIGRGENVFNVEEESRDRSGKNGKKKGFKTTEKEKSEIGKSTLKQVRTVRETFVELAFTGEGKPFYRATQDLDPGFVVLEEHPFVYCLLKEQQSNRCRNCAKNCGDYVVPCPDCPYVQYCGWQCQSSHRPVHARECKLSALLRPSNESEALLVLALQSILKEDPEQWNRLANATNWDYDGVKTELYKGLSPELKNHLDEFAKTQADSSADSLTLLDITIKAVFLVRLLKQVNYGKLDPKKDKPNVEAFFGGFLLRHLLVFERMVSTFTGAKEGSGDGDGSTNGVVPLDMPEEDVGFGVYPYSALFAHSCAPNAVRIFVGMNSLVVITRPVASGDTVTISATGDLFCSTKKPDRQKSLEERLPSFLCDCVACREDWPVAKPGGPFFQPILTIIEAAEFLQWPCCRVQLSASNARPFLGNNRAATCPCPKCGKCIGDEMRKIASALSFVNNALNEPFVMFGGWESVLEVLVPKLIDGIKALSFLSLNRDNPVLWRFASKLSIAAALDLRHRARNRAD